MRFVARLSYSVFIRNIKSNKLLTAVIFQQYDLDIQTLPKKKFKGNCLQ